MTMRKRNIRRVCRVAEIGMTFQAALQAAGVLVFDVQDLVRFGAALTRPMQNDYSALVQ